jgi:hypothetical protein
MDLDIKTDDTAGFETWIFANSGNPITSASLSYLRRVIGSQPRVFLFGFMDQEGGQITLIPFPSTFRDQCK